MTSYARKEVALTLGANFLQVEYVVKCTIIRYCSLIVIIEQKNIAIQTADCALELANVLITSRSCSDSGVLWSSLARNQASYFCYKNKVTLEQLHFKAFL